MKPIKRIMLIMLLMGMVLGPQYVVEVVAQNGATTFVVRIENIAQDNALTANGANVPVLLSPGVWLTHTQNRPLFASGFPDYGEGLEALAEDGNPVPLSAFFDSQSNIEDSGVFNTPLGAAVPGPIAPGQAYEFTVNVSQDERLSFATMFVQSNDLFYAPNEIGIALFDSSNNPINGDLSALLRLWDAGTEVNQQPGVGGDQAPRQSGPNTGRSEGGVVQQVGDGFRYPRVSEVVKLTVRPLSGGGTANDCSGDTDSARYTMTFDATWSAATHPTDFPNNPHFSGLIGATHNSDITFWQQGDVSSPGIKNMAETGSKSPLNSEIQAAIGSGHAEHALSGGGISLSPGVRSLSFEISASHPLVTLVSMIAPSPDWFVGISAMSLCEAGRWVESRTVKLLPWDAGTDNGSTYDARNTPTNPAQPISAITGFPLESSSGSVPPLGTFRFVRVG